MTEPVIVGMLSLVGTLAGSLSGILVANRLVNYRLGQLEEKVERHNQVIERTFRLEGQMSEVQHEVTDLKKYHLP